MKKSSLIFIVIVLFILLYVFYKYANENIKTESNQITLNQNSPINGDISDLEIPFLKSNDTIIKHLGYSLSYNETHEQANWVAYQLTSKETKKLFDRTDKFIPDPLISTKSASNEDYSHSGFDRGHLAPAGDMGWSEKSMSESFYFSNISPQVPAFNRGIWKKLEEQVRIWAVENSELYIVTGPILSNNLQSIGRNNVSVPKYYFKVILDYKEPNIKAIGFIIENKASKENLQKYVVSIDSVENLSKIDFYPNLPDDIETKLENSVCTTCWSW